MLDRQDHCILVVESDHGMRDTMVQILARRQERIVAVATVTDAIVCLADAEANVDVVLCNFHLMSSPGVHFMREIHARDADLPVILVGSAPRVSDVVEALRGGAHDFLAWPIADAHILLLAVERALDTRRLREDNRRYRARLEAANLELEHNVALLREDEDAGRRVQQRILPDSPRDYGWCHVEHCIIPSLYLSGDFVDYFEVGERQLAFYLADVSGHGTSSAFVTMLLKTIGNRARREIRRDPANLVRPSLMLALANRELLSLGLGKHVTMFCGVIDFTSRQLHFSVAGQYPQAIVLNEKCAEYLGGKGMPVGLFDEAVYEDRMHALPEGFALVLLSDGVMELMGDGSLAEKEARLLQVVGNGAVTVETLSRELQLDGSRGVPDDVAMLFIRDGGATPGS